MNQFEEEQAIESVQIEDVQQAAAKYFTESGLSTATVGPDQGS
jgi:predicted Zn-dependent peptidase